MTTDPLEPSDAPREFRAAGVAYREIAEMPGEAFFDCERMHAGLRVAACAQMWRHANEARGDRYAACRNCALGAAHAGVANASTSPIRGALVCARCAQGATRLIRKNLCVSCYNREREIIIGRNARGMVPTKLAPLAPRAVYVRSDGCTRYVRADRTASARELVVATLRDAMHAVAFAWRGPRVGLRQMRLF